MGLRIGDVIIKTEPTYNSCEGKSSIEKCCTNCVRRSTLESQVCHNKLVRFKTEQCTSLIGGYDEIEGERGSTLGDGGDAAVVADSREEPRQGG